MEPLWTDGKLTDGSDIHNWSIATQGLFVLMQHLILKHEGCTVFQCFNKDIAYYTTYVQVKNVS